MEKAWKSLILLIPSHCVISEDVAEKYQYAYIASMSNIKNMLEAKLIKLSRILGLINSQDLNEPF